MIILQNGLEVADADLMCLEADLENVEQWVKDAVKGKINNCKKRLLRNEVPKLLYDPEVQTIPANEAELVQLIVSRPGYKNKAQRVAEAHKPGV